MTSHSYGPLALCVTVAYRVLASTAEIFGFEICRVGVQPLPGMMRGDLPQGPSALLLLRDNNRLSVVIQSRPSGTDRTQTTTDHNKP